MRIVFVHGMRQEGKAPKQLERLWTDALDQSWHRSGLTKPDYEILMPLFGDLLHRLTEEVRDGRWTAVVKGAGETSEFSPLEAEVIAEWAAHYGVTRANVSAEPGAAVTTKGVANWDLTQALARLLERYIPGLRNSALRLVRQVDAYLTRPHIRDQIDSVVEPALASSPDIVIAHSLGSVVAYRLLTRLGAKTDVDVLLTLGSPLGINAVRDWLRPPWERVPAGVRRWVNGADDRDYVALNAQLTAASFCVGIENLTDFRNGSDAHNIADYLADPRIAGLIAQTAPIV